MPVPGAGTVAAVGMSVNRRAAAAPVTDARGRKVAFVMVVGFKQRIDSRMLRRIGQRCANAAGQISRRIGGHAGEAA